MTVTNLQEENREEMNYLFCNCTNHFWIWNDFKTARWIYNVDNIANQRNATKSIRTRIRDTQMNGV